jgi:dihydroflavonol-4-reductase
VRATSKLQWLQDKPLETVVVDLADPADCRNFLRGTTSLIHCSGVVSGANEAAYQQGNVVPTANLTDAAHLTWQDDATFVLISSLAAHGPGSLTEPAVEDSPCRPITAYGRSKRDAEKILLDSAGGFRKVILRPPSLYGPRDREFLPLLKAATRGWTVRLGNRMTGLSLVNGRDAAHAAVLLLTTESAHGIYFISDAQVGYEWRQIQAALAAAAGRTVRRVEVPLGALRVAASLTGLLGNEASLLLNPDRMRDLDTEGWVCDGSRLTRDTGFVAHYNATTGFTETLDFYRKQGWL